MSKMKVEVNSEIKEILRSKSIPIHDGIAVLLTLYFGVYPSYIPSELERKVLASNIVSKDFTNEEIIWLVPLFEESITGFEWVGTWMDLFKSVNPSRRGVKAEVLKRMKKFFTNNPSVRVEDVMEATKLYLKSVENVKFCKSSHKFIAEIDGTSMLLNYVKQLEEIKARDYIFKSDII